MRQRFGVADILAAGEAAEDVTGEAGRSADDGCFGQGGIRNHRTCKVAQPERIVQFPEGQHSSIRGDPAGVEFELRDAEPDLGPSLQLPYWL
jgi:hypothetical protein